MGTKKILILILFAALAVRLIGIDYGLPLTLIHDEPPFVFGALKMLELKTLIPSLHSSQFESALYYPPYLSYLYLPFFALVISLKSLFFSGDFETLKNILIADPSVFFIIARIISALLGTATVYLAYLIAKRLFQSERVALLSALSLALSYIHTLFSHWGRHWGAVTFVFTLALYFLTKNEWGDRKRYLLTALVLGLGVGVNYQMGVAFLILPIWALIYDRVSIRNLIWPGALFAGLGAFAYGLYPAGLPVNASDVVNSSKSIAGFLDGFTFHFTNLLANDPALLIFSIIGFYFCFRYSKKLFYALGSFAFLYIAIFYILLFQVDRYVIMLLPVLALLSGFTTNQLLKLLSGETAKFSKFAIFPLVLIFAYSGVNIARLDQLLVRNDTRVQALEWIKLNIPSGKETREKIIVIGDKMRLPATREAIAELELIDPTALRSVDQAERKLAPPDAYHALNLYNVGNQEFAKNSAFYASQNNYRYLVLDHEYVSRKNFGPIIEVGDTLMSWSGYLEEKGDLANWFGGGLYARQTIESFTRDPFEIWKIRNLGPVVEVRKLQDI
ncbi:MAG TPA: glycosyltransferase family 39 protein [Candidatus Paceibacterota bacterium]